MTLLTAERVAHTIFSVRGGLSHCPALQTYASELVRSGPSAFLCGLANEALLEAVGFTDPQNRLLLVRAILDGPSAPLVKVDTASDLVLSRAIEERACECLPALVAAGFSLKNTALDREMVVGTMAEGKWPHPDLVCPGLAQCAQIAHLPEGVIRALKTYPGRGVLEQGLRQVGRWAGDEPLGDRLTQGLVRALKQVLYQKLLFDDADEAEGPFVELIKLGMDPGPAMGFLQAQTGERVLADGVEALLLHAQALALDGLTAPASSRAGMRRL